MSADRWAAFTDDELTAIATMEPGASDARIDDVIFALGDEIAAERERRRDSWPKPPPYPADDEGRAPERRCVWLTDEQVEEWRDLLTLPQQPELDNALAAIVAAWDAAPADPAEAVCDAMFPSDWLERADYDDALRSNAVAVLRALGWEAPA